MLEIAKKPKLSRVRTGSVDIRKVTDKIHSITATVILINCILATHPTD